MGRNISSGRAAAARGIATVVVTTTARQHPASLERDDDLAVWGAR